MSQTSAPANSSDESVFTEDRLSRERSRRSLFSQINILVRRIHLYTGLFLLPWVILYGVTGAMFNHLGLFPRLAIQPVEQSVVANTEIASFPSAEDLAQQVVDALQSSTNSTGIVLSENHGAEFTNDLMFEMKHEGLQHVVYIDPISKSSWVGIMPKNDEEPETLLTEIKEVKLDQNPQQVAQKAAEQILEQTGIQASGELKPFGWTKLNFLAEVDGAPARVTYVLKDGHVDINRFTGHSGQPLRQFLLRMHTSHGQPPHWNGRMFWSLAVDTMAIAMVGWGLSGVFMWWQIKRTRIIGAIVIAMSVLTAVAMWIGLQTFYATTRL